MAEEVRFRVLTCCDCMGQFHCFQYGSRPVTLKRCVHCAVRIWPRIWRERFQKAA